MRKILSFVLAALLLCSVCTSAAGAVVTGDFEYETSNGELVLTKYAGSGGKVTIPSSVGGKDVVRLEDSAFAESDITGVSIPGSVREIGDNCFKNCTHLSFAVVPDSVVYIGYDAFSVNSSDFKLRCYKDSYAQQYALNNDIQITLLLPIPEAKISALKPNQLHLSWEKVENAEEYYIYRVSDSGEKIKIASTEKLSYDVTGLDGNSEYKYYVRAIGDEETGEASEFNELYILTARTLCDRPRVKAYYGTDSVRLTWDSIDGAKSYRIYRIEKGKRKLLKESTETEYLYSNLQTGVDLVFFVSSVDSSGVETQYDEKYLIKTSTICRAPKFSAVASWRSIDVEWEQVEGAKYYTVFIASGDKEGYTIVEEITDPEQTTYTIGGKLSPMKTYRVLVRAFNEYDDGSAYTENDAAICRIKGFYIYAAAGAFIVVAAITVVILLIIKKRRSQYEVNCG